MTLYFMHLRGPSGEVLDTDGVLMHEEEVAAAALLAARDCMAHDIRSGQLDLTYGIEVQNEDGVSVHTLDFADAVQILPA
jgi:hypothetical protein